METDFPQPHPKSYSSTRAVAAVASALLVLMSTTCWLKAEEWSGHEGGSLRQNASLVSIPPEALPAEPTWMRAFKGARINVARTGSYNLVTRGPYLAVIGADPGDSAFDFEGNQVSAGELWDNPSTYLPLQGIYNPIIAQGRGWASLVEIETGKVASTFEVVLSVGDNHASASWPSWWDGLSTSDSDIPTGLFSMNWDPETGILFLATGGDNTSRSAWRPLDTLRDYTGRGFVTRAGAYKHLLNGQGRRLSATRGAASDLPDDFSDWFHSENWSNTMGTFQVDPSSPAMVSVTVGGHNQGNLFSVFNKYSGLRAARPTGMGSVPSGWNPASAFPLPRSVFEPDRSVRLFAHRDGVLVSGNRIFAIGAADSSAADLGDLTWIERGNPATYDQGLHIFSWTVDWYDSVDQGWRDKDPGAELESAVLSLDWSYGFHSESTPSNWNDMVSWVEDDFFYSNKAWLVDGDGVWVAWKPALAGGVQLIHADVGSAMTWDLGVGHGMRGPDLDPYLAFARLSDGGRRIVYYHGTRNKRLRYGFTNWSAAWIPPAGPAELVNFDAGSGEVVWTYDVSSHHPDCPVSWAVTKIESRSRMLAAGDYAYLAWVDAGPLHYPTAADNYPAVPPSDLPYQPKQGNAELVLVGFDLDLPTAVPVQRRYDLGFPAADWSTTNLTDIIADDGRIIALITRSRDRYPGKRDFEEQLVVALEAAGNVVNEAPLAVAGPDRAVPDSDGLAGEEIVLDASLSSGSGGNIVSWHLEADGRLIASGETPAVRLPDGLNLITLRVTDDTGQQDTDALHVEVAPPNDKVAPLPPAGLSAVPGNQRVYLNWSASGEGDFAGYRVHMQTGAGGEFHLMAGNLEAPSLVVNGLRNGQEYSFRVESVDTAGNASGFGAGATAIPSPTGGRILFHDGNPSTQDWFFVAHAALGPEALDIGPYLRGGDALRFWSGMFSNTVGSKSHAFDNAYVLRSLGETVDLEVGDRLVLEFSIMVPPGPGNQINIFRSLGFRLIGAGGRSLPGGNAYYGTAHPAAGATDNQDFTLDGPQAIHLGSSLSIGNREVANGVGNPATQTGGNSSKLFAPSGIPFTVNPLPKFLQPWDGTRVRFSVERTDDISGYPVYRIRTEAWQADGVTVLSVENTTGKASSPDNNYGTAAAPVGFTHVALGIEAATDINTDSTGRFDFSLDDIRVEVFRRRPLPELSLVDGSLQVSFGRDPEDAGSGYAVMTSDDMLSWVLLARMLPGGTWEFSNEARLVSEVPADGVVWTTIADRFGRDELRRFVRVIVN